MEKIKIADIGAANHSIENRWINLKHDIEIILFEPDQRSYESLIKKGYDVYPKALFSSLGKKTLNLTRKPECSSFYEPNLTFLKNFPDPDRWDIIDQIEIDVDTLDSFQLNIDFLKLDTQGSELDILVGSENTLKKTLGMEIEVSFTQIYKGQPLFGDICNFLYLHGFEFYDFVTEYRYGRKALDRKGQLSFADALFLRTPENILNTNIEKIHLYNSIVKAYNKEDLIIQQ